MSLLSDTLKTNSVAFRTGRSVKQFLGRYNEPEMGLLPFVVDRSRAAIDVGAHTGAYVHLLLKLAASVTAIEANPQIVRTLTKMYGKRARILCAAASSADGTAALRIPVPRQGLRYGLGTIEPENTLAGVEVDEVKVPKVILDQINCGPVGFIKIDVEGHEYDVLLGAQKIIFRDHPAIILEAEERHRRGAVKSVCELLSKFNYNGFMLDKGRLVPISRFDVSRDQGIAPEDMEPFNVGKRPGRYINNFLFLA